MKTLIFQGHEFKYNDFWAEEIMANIFEVSLLCGLDIVCVLTLDSDQLNKL